MGYILPVTPYQYMQYSERIELAKASKESYKTSGSKRIFPLKLQTELGDRPSMYQRNQPHSVYKNTTPLQVNKMLTSINGIGLIFDEKV